MPRPVFADPAAEMEVLRPLVDQLRAMQLRCRPFSVDYLALAIPLQALEDAGRTLTGQRMVFGSHGDHR